MARQLAPRRKPGKGKCYQSMTANGVRYVTLDRPDVRNALNLALIRRLARSAARSEE